MVVVKDELDFGFGFFEPEADLKGLKGMASVVVRIALWLWWGKSGFG